MELNRTMILLSGCFLIVWSTFKWKIPHVIWDVKLTRVCSVILGLYNIILAICFEKDLSIFLFIVSLKSFVITLDSCSMKFIILYFLIFEVALLYQ